MTLALILVLAAVGAAGTAYALPLDGRRARAAAAGGVLVLLLIAALAIAGAGPAVAVPGADPAIPAGSAWGGALLPGSYLRLVIALLATMAALLATMAWLLGGFSELPGLLPAFLSAVGGTTVALSASEPVVAALGAAGTGLVAIPLVLARRRSGRTYPALRELRASLVTGAIIAGAAAITEVVTRIVFADPSAVVPESGSPTAATAGLVALGLGLAAAVRSGSVPFHLRLARLADVTPPIGLPVVAAWIPLPLMVAALIVANGMLAPLAFPLDAERAALVVLALVGLGGAALAAFITDDLRHSVVYLTAADSALVLIAFAALDPSTSGPARAWLVVVLVSKTALGAWGAVVEDRFATKGLPDLRGWARRAPVLGVAFLVIVLATFGLPGWVSFEVRELLPQTAVIDPWATMLVVAGFLTLPTYVRIGLLGIGRPAANVHRAEPERFRYHLGSRARATGQHAARLGRHAARLGRHGVRLGRDLGSRVGRRTNGTPALATDDVAPPVDPAAETVPDRVPPSSAVRSTGARSRAAAASRIPTATSPVPAETTPSAPADSLAEGIAVVGAMRPRSVGSAANRARAGLVAAAERGRAAVPSADEVRRGRTELLSASVLLLALLGALLAMGGLNVNQAAAELSAGPASGLEGN